MYRHDETMAASKIEWTDETWNPVTGCVKVSPGCKHCYAETFSERFRGTISGTGKPHPFFTGFDPSLRPERLDTPYAWRTPRRVFVNSMSDLFGDFVPDDFLARVFAVMRDTQQHTYQVLTKRAPRLRTWTSAHPWLRETRHISLGVSVEDRKYGLPRIDDLRAANAAVRFLTRFLGTDQWKSRIHKSNPVPRILMLIEQLGKFGYVQNRVRVAAIKTKGKELYHLFLASKDRLALDLWESILDIDSKGQLGFKNV